MPEQTFKKHYQNILDYPGFRKDGRGSAPFLPMSRKEMTALGWDFCDIILVSGDAYVDHPSFCTAIIGRYLEAFGFRVGVIAQSDWKSRDAFMILGRPRLFFGVTAGNMDSMINHYTAERRIRSDDAYTPGNAAGKRPDRATVVYTQRIKEAYKGIPVVLGGIEASLRRFAHYDYWSDTVKNSVLPDSKADILVYGNGERPIIEIAWRLSQGEDIKSLTDIRGTAVMLGDLPLGFTGIDARKPEAGIPIPPRKNPYCDLCSRNDRAQAAPEQSQPASPTPSQNPSPSLSSASSPDPAAAPAQSSAVSALSAAASENVSSSASSSVSSSATSAASPAAPSAHAPAPDAIPEKYVLMPSAEEVKKDRLSYAQAAHLMLLETNPYCARCLAQAHGSRYVWVNPPSFPLTTPEYDAVYELPFRRVPHPAYKGERIPAYDMIKESVSIMRGCFGGCSFCSITAHEGKIIQSRSEDSVVHEVTEVKDKTPGFKGVLSDLGGPSANMYRLGCSDPRAQASCRRPSCLYPEPCRKLNTDHRSLIELYRRIRSLPFIRRVFIASGVRIDLALRDPEYIRELVTHHVGGLLKIAPEHTEPEVLSRMLKPAISGYDEFKKLFDRYSAEAGKKQYLIPYFMSSHPGSDLKSMIRLALWLKKRGFELDQVQNYIPTPMAGAAAMYYTGMNPYERIKSGDNSEVFVAKGDSARKRQKAILRYHDPANFAVIREALRELGMEYLIGTGPDALVPPAGAGDRSHASRPRYGFEREERGRREDTGRNNVRNNDRMKNSGRSAVAGFGNSRGNNPGNSRGNDRGASSKKPHPDSRNGASGKHRNRNKDR